MRILDEVTDRPCRRVTVLLTHAEAGELRDALVALLNDPDPAGHEHISSEDFRKELTVMLYGEDIPSGVHERIRTLIQFDK